ncbi:hypothetical protein CB0940_07797 [Cercospora beticola]|uniref:Uncharacterized protein n=1 Tax=Cercospora beticola TaxID=122368 RepID=A0A2G5H9W0_CERBT|nr:hypothetical protein CB0940_07797 [Cercospora beticola]PIA89307.1 hypothetical protein CB0940_07797 [Cercospora beticola]WPB03765.1 hypothetical protein RHO25_008409 [Cercospora beticola]CAK1357470.1 unnamed protein product [Cercospora beticola]
MPGQRRYAFSTPNTSLPSPQTDYDTGAMRLHSTEARFDALESKAFRARHLPRVQESSRRLDAVASDGVPEPWYDEKEVKIWRMPQRVADDRNQGSVQLGPVSRTAHRGYAMPVEPIPEILIEMASPVPVQASLHAIHSARPSLKRKCQNDLQNEQPPAQRLKGLHLSIPQLQRPWDMDTSSVEHGGTYLPRAVRPIQRPVSSLSHGAFSLMPIPFPGGPRLDAMHLQPPSAAIHPQVPIPTFDTQRTTIFPPLLPTYHKASPPPCVPQLADLPNHPNFLYWTPSLSRRILEWLNDANTDSTQRETLGLTFRDFGNSFHERCRSPGPGYGMKVTRMTISNQAGIDRSSRQDNASMTDGADFLDWFVIQFGELAAPRDRPAHYWVMAFPVCAVTKRHCELITSAQPNNGGAIGASGLYKTTWTLGRTNRLPLLHGSGVREAYLQNFFSACMFGAGVIEMESFGGVFD